MKRILVIQTAFIGDVILATALLEKLHNHFPDAHLAILVRKGNESLFHGHPFLHECLIWDKEKNKYKNLIACIRKVRKKHYDLVINCQRFAASGLIAAFSKAKKVIGFDKNPFSFLFNQTVPHTIGDGQHETARNQALIAAITDQLAAPPRLYPPKVELPQSPYVCIAPASVWTTKQLPLHQWKNLCENIPEEYGIVFLGGAADMQLTDEITKGLSREKNIQNLCGKLNLLQSAAVMKHAEMNYVNDSAPLHLASAVNAPVCVFFCSTIPEFGFGPLSDKQLIIQVNEKLNCRPCGLHGKRACPEGHFKCGNDINFREALAPLFGPV